MSAGEELMAFHIKALKLGKPMREYQFHPARKWRFDFAWPSHGLALEVEGGTFTNGRHNRGVGFEQDCEKYCEAALMGYRVLRVTTAMVKDGRAVEWLRRALKPA